ncbi:hypothetical protein HHL16_11885 [Pseudoflavitalea sp. G-6-1-2]|uniref:PKD-like family lipoprotein n=1 Tax=Pseudoflavitalea sp. G-6-1-2 TaxID=2728841 RepID=UPI00146EFA12|nr:PKD-like family lipoprotein [Pseudoflavitalea sp. G-6-1-2]NML21580.1 hypothetical protein [Pseudoflavitalea sp. G-6-1-2]
MKLIHQCLVIGSMLLISACYKDHGNYSYAEGEKITIEGVDAMYDRVALVDRLSLKPTVRSNDPNAAFSYWWGIYEPDAMGKIDTISHEHQLDYLITQRSKEYTLVFGVKNENTGVGKTVSTVLNVTTQFTRGWYVMKHKDGFTDLDLFFTPQSIAPATKLENVLMLGNNQKVEGQGTLFGFAQSYPVETDGQVFNNKVLFVQADKGMAVVDINTMKIANTMNSLFYETPAAIRPSAICNDMSGTYLLNDGAMHTMLYEGIFGSKKMRDNKNTPYRLSRYFLIDNNSYISPLFFDELSSSFVSGSTYTPTLKVVNDYGATQMPASKNNKELLFMGLKAVGSPLAGTAVLRDKTDPALRIITNISSYGTIVTLKNDTIPVTAKVNLAEHYAMIMGEENMLYFSVGNEVWSRNLSNGTEQLQYAAAAGEQISFIRHRKYAGPAIPSEQPFYYNYMLIGTTANGRYKIHAFKKSSGNLASTPDFTMEGEGAAADAIYISPLVNGSTYCNTY